MVDILTRVGYNNYGHWCRVHFNFILCHSLVDLLKNLNLLQDLDKTLEIINRVKLHMLKMTTNLRT